MILHQVKEHLGLSEPVTRKFVALMDATFRYYGEIRSLFFDKLPQHLLQSELVSLVNVEIKNRLFDEKFCAGIQDSLRTVQHANIRLEDLRKQNPDHPDAVNNLSRLAALGERVEALYQKHWEFHRYQNRITEEDLVRFILEIDQAGYEWDNYTYGFSAIKGLLDILEGRGLPEGFAPLRISYQRQGVRHFSVSTLRCMLNFLEAGYRFICAVGEIDPETQPLTLVHAEMGEPVQLLFAVPESASSPYRKFLQHLFLKDMLKRDALLKVVFLEVCKEMGREKPLTPTVMTGFQKEMTAELKKLPEDGRFSISNRTFPDDGIQVLQEFTTALDEKNIRYDTLLRGETRKSTSPSAKIPSKPKEGSPPPPRTDTGQKENVIPGLGPLLKPLVDKEHIAVLTEKSTE